MLWWCPPINICLETHVWIYVVITLSVSAQTVQVIGDRLTKLFNLYHIQYLQWAVQHKMQWRSRLRHCATCRKVTGSIPNGFTGIFHWHNPSGRTMALGLTQPLTEMSTRSISWGKRRPVRRADNLTTFMCRMSWNLGASTSWNPQDLSRPVMGLL